MAVYLTGRKNCSSCKRWRHISDFRVHIWNDGEMQTIRSLCKACENYFARRRYKPTETKIDAKVFLSFMNPTRERIHPPHDSYFINGKRLTSSEYRCLKRWQNGEFKSVTLSTADAWCTRFDLPFWELEEIAKMSA